VKLSQRVAKAAGSQSRAGGASSVGATLRPPRYHIGFVDDWVNPMGVPDPLKARIESLSGMDLSDVRVHTSSDKPAQLQALAYTRGNDIHLAPGQERQLAHEAWHVVQQRQGRVRPTVRTNGVAINDDPALEKEADSMGAKALEGRSRSGPATSVPPTAVASEPVVQRSVGFEFELRAEDWNIREKQSGRPPEKGTPVIHGKDFQLQAEYSGANLAVCELVTNYPGVQTRDQFDASVKDMQRLGGELDAVKPDTAGVSAAKFAGGDPDFVMDKRTNDAIKNASLQVTAGVPLASVGALFKNLEGIVPQHEAGVYQQARARADYVGGYFASREFQGLMILLQQYLGQLKAGGPRQAFVKGMIKVMARTDFHAMFDLLPQADRTWIMNNMNKWIGYMLSGKTSRFWSATGFAPQERLVTPIIADPGSTDPAMQITTTRDAWLRALPRQDLLSYRGRTSETAEVEMFPGRSTAQIDEDIRIKGETRELLAEREKAFQNQLGGTPYGKPRTPEEQYHVEENDRRFEAEMLEPINNLYEGLGKLGAKTDFIKYQGQQQPTAAPILEIRNPPPAGPVSNWFKSAKAIYDAVDEAIQYPGGRGILTWPKSYTNELTKGQLEKRQEALDLAKALEDRLRSLEKKAEEKS
jgi:hypothetical protein